MSVDKVREYLRSYGFEDRIKEFDISTATVAEAAEAVGVIPARIAKTLSFQSEECGCILVLMAGDAKVDNKKYRARFGVKPHMLTHEDALQYTGHAVGGVCPFAVPDSVPVYLDVLAEPDAVGNRRVGRDVHAGAEDVQTLPAGLRAAAHGDRVERRLELRLEALAPLLRLPEEELEHDLYKKLYHEHSSIFNIAAITCRTPPRRIPRARPASAACGIRAG